VSVQDAELEAMRSGVSCAVLLERHPPPWQLEKKESTRNCLKYRRAKCEIPLVTHEGRAGGIPPAWPRVTSSGWCSSSIRA
jgi:hypothetical protein